MTIVEGEGLPPVSERTVPGVLARGASLWPDRTAISDADTAVTYRQVWDEARRRASALLALTGRKGVRVVTLLDNNVDAALTWLGIATAGLVEVPVNVAYRGSVLMSQIADSQAEYAITEARYVDRLIMTAEGTRLRHVVVRGATEMSTAGHLVLHSGGLLDGEEGDSLPNVTGADPVAIMYTSGTTGKARGVLVAHAHAYTYGAPQVLGFARPGDVAMVVLPLFHVGGQWGGLYNALIAGAEAHVSPRFSGQTFWEEARTHNCTCSLLVIAMANHLLQMPSRPDDRDNPFERMMLAPVPSDGAQFAERFGIEICSGYGSTEAGTVFMAPFGTARPRACGWPRKGIDTRIVGPDDTPVPPGQMGELVVRSQEPWTTMVEYVGRPEETVAAWRNLWYHTGDAMYVDEDGQYVYVDRLGDAIRRRGENVPSAEVEAAINRHPSVLESAVVGIPGSSEHEVLAAVVPRPERAADPDELIEWLATVLPHFMVPRYIRIVAALERTPSGKIRKRPIRDLGSEGAWDREKTGIHVGREGLQRRQPT